MTPLDSLALSRGTVDRVTDKRSEVAWLDAAWAEPRQRGRALDSLVADGLVDPLPDGHFALPGMQAGTGKSH